MNSVDKTEWEKYACKKFFFLGHPNAHPLELLNRVSQKYIINRILMCGILHLA